VPVTYRTLRFRRGGGGGIPTDPPDADADAGLKIVAPTTPADAEGC
jgi:hypothetical protein